jgi:hypothetical protein
MSASVYSVADFQRAFGARPGDESLIAAEAAKHDFTYHRLPAGERDAVILQVLQRLDGFTRVGEHRHEIWENAWADVARRYDASGGDLASLAPPFMSATPVLRVAGDYARPVDPRFELNWFAVFRHWLFSRHLGAAERVFEFGCGSGFNLTALAGLHPQLRLCGLDWTESVVALVDRIGAQHGLNLRGRRFDFFAPDPDLTLGPGSVALTFAALEQTGDRYEPFLSWLLERRPDLVINMEPAIELYDPTSLVDHLAIRYHQHRGYLNGYFARVQELARRGEAEILDVRRLGFGSQYHEGYSLLIWRPGPPRHHG